ncbi:9989_t:CDS:10 [Ambispora gerdemannii]|uniref:9989_t:CDS:1 n=1 Tax=Ambispora gerdemannii TaxID=144530 RepID=A0A9N8V279_9GLOM|nr:9989_t:CDS:10 [Ambispora gerdemannii]
MEDYELSLSDNELIETDPISGSMEWQLTPKQKGKGKAVDLVGENPFFSPQHLDEGKSRETEDEWQDSNNKENYGSLTNYNVNQYQAMDVDDAFDLSPLDYSTSYAGEGGGSSSADASSSSPSLIQQRKNMLEDDEIPEADRFVIAELLLEEEEQNNSYDPFGFETETSVSTESQIILNTSNKTSNYNYNPPLDSFDISDFNNDFNFNMPATKSTDSYLKSLSVANTPSPLSSIFTERPKTGEFLKATTSKGLLLYFPKKSQTTTELPLRSYDKSCLHDLSISRLISKIEKDKIAKAELSRTNLTASKPTAKIKTETKLWVDKYRPKRYIDLVGDEKANREILRWVKQWDYCVFGTKSKENEVIEEKIQDPWHRPEKKVLLLNGPPGYGKTTLAHVIARHCGYNAIEVNASDDRTANVVNNQIKDSLENKSINPNHKPTLLIIDEVDGASGSGEQNFVKVLVDLIQGEAKAHTMTKKKPGIASSAKKSVKKSILFPIICICNDQYASALRSLRLIAQIFQIRKCPTQILANRLKDICDREKLSADMRTLSNLVETSDGDMRSCLNTLQYVKQKSDVVTIELIAESGVGIKDTQSTIFTIWEEIFTLSTAKKRKDGLNSMLSETMG